MEIVLKSNVKQDDYTEYIKNAFDLQVGDVSKVSIPINFDISTLKDWQIGVVCGASGSGKSTILKSLGEIVEPTFDDAKCLISNFDNMPPTRCLSTIVIYGFGECSYLD